MKLVALVDGSIYSQSVCDHAAWVSARVEECKLDLLHVLDDRHRASAKSNLSGSIGLGARTSIIEELAELDAKQAKFAQKAGRAILEDAEARLNEAKSNAAVETKLRNGDLVETVTTFEKDADLIIIGKRGEAADFAKMHLGSNLERVVRSSQKPVMVVSRMFKTPNKLMLAYDGGQSAETAVKHLCADPMYQGLDCHILTVASDIGSSLSDKLENAKSRLVKAGFTVTSEVKSGQPGNVISETAEQEDVDLLVLGAYGHSHIRNLIIGSTTTEVIRKCLTPVVLYR